MNKEQRALQRLTAIAHELRTTAETLRQTAERLHTALRNADAGKPTALDEHALDEHAENAWHLRADVRHENFLLDLLQIELIRQGAKTKA